MLTFSQQRRLDRLPCHHRVPHGRRDRHRAHKSLRGISQARVSQVTAGPAASGPIPRYESEGEEAGASSHVISQSTTLLSKCVIFPVHNWCPLKKHGRAQFGRRRTSKRAGHFVICYGYAISFGTGLRVFNCFVTYPGVSASLPRDRYRQLFQHVLKGSGGMCGFPLRES